MRLGKTFWLARVSAVEWGACHRLGYGSGRFCRSMWQSGSVNWQSMRRGPRDRVYGRRLGGIRGYVGCVLGCVCGLHVGGVAAVPVEHERVSEMKSGARGAVAGPPCWCRGVPVRWLGPLGVSMGPADPRRASVGCAWGVRVWGGRPGYEVWGPGRGCGAPMSLLWGAGAMEGFHWVCSRAPPTPWWGAEGGA